MKRLLLVGWMLILPFASGKKGEATEATAKQPFPMGAAFGMPSPLA